MKPRRIHVVSLQNPFPPDYGGAIDIYYRIKALHDAGVYVILHTYRYGSRGEHRTELSEIANEVYFYERSTGWTSQISLLPYIVYSRRNPELLVNLNKDSAPIIFEGLHTTYFLGHPSLKNRIKIVRAHNVEHTYYRKLSQSGGNIFNRLYHYIESVKLRHYEHRLSEATAIAPLNEAEAAHFRRAFPATDIIPTPVFYNESPEPVSATGSYILYHGNLSVAENALAAEWIISNIASEMPDVSFIIAGKQPSETLSAKIAGLSNVTLIRTPSANEMDELIDKAKAHLLITFQSTGVKLKLINVLHRKGYVIANNMMVSGSGLDHLCKTADTPAEIRDMIREALSSCITPSGLPDSYNPRNNISNLLDYISRQEEGR